MRKAFWQGEKIGRSPLSGRDTTRPWVARITGLSAEYEYHRQFLRAKQDWTQANSAGTRGAHFVYTLTEGEFYEAYRKTSQQLSERIFLTVTAEGDVVEIEQEEVDQWLLSTKCVYRIAPAA